MRDEPGVPVATSGAAASLEQRHVVIDAVRGVSIVLVVLLHVQLRIPLQKTWLFQAAPSELWHLLCRNGNAGVRMFFVVSGFLITTNSLRRWGSLARLDVRRFYRLRFARIAPALAALLLVLCLLHLGGVEGYVIDPSRWSLGRALLAAATFHINWLEASRNAYLPASWDVLWSLSVEEVFYLLFPLGALLFRWPLAGHTLLLGLIALGAWVRCRLVDAPMWQSKGYLPCADALALGCYAAIVSHGHALPRWLVRTLVWGGGALTLAVLTYAHLPQLRYLTDRDLHLTVLALGTAALMVAGVRVRVSAITTRWLRPLLACGRLSYEIYLTHAFVVLGAVAWFRAQGQPPAAVYPLLAAILVASWALGAAVERWLSAPANRWLRGKRGRARGATAVARDWSESRASAARPRARRRRACLVRSSWKCRVRAAPSARTARA
jgi:peptidoglycan/LPS O-acetylase OafA/YrhL